MCKAYKTSRNIALDDLLAPEQLETFLASQPPDRKFTRRIGEYCPVAECLKSLKAKGYQQFDVGSTVVYLREAPTQPYSDSPRAYVPSKHWLRRFIGEVDRETRYEKITARAALRILRRVLGKAA